MGRAFIQNWNVSGVYKNSFGADWISFEEERLLSPGKERLRGKGGSKTDLQKLFLEEGFERKGGRPMILFQVVTATRFNDQQPLGAPDMTVWAPNNKLTPLA